MRKRHILFFILGAAVTAYIFMILSAESALDTLVTRSMPIVAVNPDLDAGVMGTLRLRLIPGNSDVLIDTNPFAETDLQYSSNIAVDVAKFQTGNSAPNTDFIFTYDIVSDVIGGQSAGAAAAIAAIAALDKSRIKDGVVITGTINPNGSIGPVGAVLEKAQAAGEAGYREFLVPEGQSHVIYVQPMQKDIFGRIIIYPEEKVIDLKEEAYKMWNISVSEVSDIGEALRYMVVR